MTLVEVMIALVVITVGILAASRLFPANSRMQVATRMRTVGIQYADQQLERLRGFPKTNSALSTGRHPASGYDTLGTTRAWLRYYSVTQMAAPLDSLLKIDTTVRWRLAQTDSVRVSVYLFP